MHQGNLISYHIWQLLELWFSAYPMRTVPELTASLAPPSPRLRPPFPTTRKLQTARP